MSELNQPDAFQPPPICPLPGASEPRRQVSRSFLYWAKRFLACNPFYLFSAALLLFGLQHVSAWPRYWHTDLTQLVFNFSSLELYEMLLVIAAVVLARRTIWYDSTLLVGLENLFVFVPFILITQGVLTNPHCLWVMCAAGGLLVISRFTAMRRFLTVMDFPDRWFGIGFVLLVLNVALPVIYHSLHESNRFGSNPNFGPQFQMSRNTWLLILPAALALGNFLPHARERELLPMQRRWFSSGFFALWLAATIVHLYCLDYVYQLHVPLAWVTPSIWILVWTASRILPDVFALPGQVAKVWLPGLAIVAPLLAVSSPRHEILLTLAGLNVIILAGISLVRRDGFPARHLLYASIVFFVAWLPANQMPWIGPWWNYETVFAIGLMAYAIFRLTLSKNPIAGLVGSLLTAATVLVAARHNPGAIHWSLQFAMAFLLLHSLRWADAAHAGAVQIRCMSGLIWVIHSFAWGYSKGSSAWFLILPALVLAICLADRFIHGRWRQIVPPAAAGLSLLSGPAVVMTDQLRLVPPGVLAIAGSFLMLGFGTLVALTKRHWHSASGD